MHAEADDHRAGASFQVAICVNYCIYRHLETTSFQPNLHDNDFTATHPHGVLRGKVRLVFLYSVTSHETPAALLAEAHVVAVHRQRGITVDTVGLQVEVIIVYVKLLLSGARQRVFAALLANCDASGFQGNEELHHQEIVWVLLGLRVGDAQEAITKKQARWIEGALPANGRAV